MTAKRISQIERMWKRAIDNPRAKADYDRTTYEFLVEVEMPDMIKFIKNHIHPIPRRAIKV